METIQPEIVAPPVEPEALPVAPSIADHASQFSKEAQEAQATETPEEKTEREHHSAQQRREKETGKFDTGKVRHRAASQQAGPGDVPRIQKLTAEKNSATERADRAEAELARLKAQHAPPAQIAKAEAKVDKATAATDDPEPTEDDPKFGGDYGKFLRAAAQWEGRQAYRNEKKSEQEAHTKAEQAASQRAALETWAGRVKLAREKIPDYDAVAFGPTAIPDGSTVDAWIMEHKAGPFVLHYLQSHRQELDSLLAKSVIDQLDDLALLSQRLLSTTGAQAGTTGSAAPTKSIVQPPKPPNPVRTEAQRVADAPPPTDGSLSISEHARHFAKQARR